MPGAAGKEIESLYWKLKRETGIEPEVRPEVVPAAEPVIEPSRGRHAKPEAPDPEDQEEEEEEEGMPEFSAPGDDAVVKVGAANECRHRVRRD